MRTSKALVRRDSRLFTELCEALLRHGNAVQFRANGQSMSPNLMDGDDVVITPIATAELRRGDIVLVENPEGLRAHRVKSLSVCTGKIQLRSDTGLDFDPSPSRIVGKVAARIDGRREEKLGA